MFWSRRLPQCVLGLAVFGIGISLLVRAELGLAPWDVFHRAVARHLDVGLGVVIEGTGLVLLLAWIPLRQRVGLGTILNAFEIGFVVDLVLPHLPTPDRLAPRIALLVGGVLAMAVASALYIGAGLGAGPRDGIMLGLAARWWTVRGWRTVVELTVVAAGLALGGSMGVGTLVFAVGIGPLVQPLLPVFRVPTPSTALGQYR